MYCSILNNNEEQILEIEELRKKVFGFEEDENHYFTDGIRRKSIITVGCFYKNKLIGGCYVTNRLGKLHIEALFVDNKFQSNKLHIGSGIVNYVNKHKATFEKLFVTNFKFSSVEPYGEDLVPFYEKLGYHRKNKETLLLRKNI